MRAASAIILLFPLAFILLNAELSNAQERIVDVALEDEAGDRPLQLVKPLPAPKPIKKDDTVVPVSPALYSAIEEYENGSGLTLTEYMLKHEPAHFNKWAGAADRKSKVSVDAFAKAENVGEIKASDSPQRSAVRARTGGSRIQDLATQKPNHFNLWQVTNLKREDQLVEFTERQYPEIYKRWKESRSIPAKKQCFFEFIEKKYPALTKESISYYERKTGKKYSKSLCLRVWPPPPPPPNLCKCDYVVTHPDQPSSYQSDNDSGQSGGNYKHRKWKWWDEEWKAAHYGEIDIYLKRQKHTSTWDYAGTKNNLNFAGIRFKLSCLDDFFVPCGTCFAKLNRYAHYASHMQVHTNGKSSLTKKYSGKASAGDGAKMTTTLENGEITDFEKAGMVTIDAKSEYDGTKVLNVIKSIIGLGVEVAKAAGGGSPDPAKIAKWTTEGIKNLFGIVKYTGTTGTKSHTLKVTFDSVSNSGDPSLWIRNNIDYTVKIESSGHTVYEGKGKRSYTNNSFYGSGFAAALTVTEFTCPDVDVPPKPMGAWTYGNAYRSPYPNMDTFKTNVRDFIAHNIGTSSGLSTSSNEGYWVP